jgi:hypothetical protein
MLRRHFRREVTHHREPFESIGTVLEATREFFERATVHPSAPAPSSVHIPHDFRRRT